MRLGVVSDDTAQLAIPMLPQYANWDFPSPPIAGPNAGLFLSLAVLSDIKRADVCSVDGRCTGLLIYYLKGRSDVFYVPHGTRAFDINVLRADVIYFVTKKYRCHQIVTDISFTGRTEVAPGSSYQIFNLGQVGTSVGSGHATC
jgi:hypothetical protein